MKEISSRWKGHRDPGLWSDVSRPPAGVSTGNGAPFPRRSGHRGELDHPGPVSRAALGSKGRAAWGYTPGHRYPGWRRGREGTRTESAQLLWPQPSSAAFTQTPVPHFSPGPAGPPVLPSQHILGRPIGEQELNRPHTLLPNSPPSSV